ncbi:MAG: hypothetical protein AAFY60_08670, partial [Myxococcota bacterium]
MIRIAVLMLAVVSFGLSGCRRSCTEELVLDSLSVEIVDDAGNPVVPASGVVTLAGEEREFDCGADPTDGPDPELDCSEQGLFFSGQAGGRLELAVTLAFYDSNGRFYVGTAEPQVTTFDT